MPSSFLLTGTQRLRGRLMAIVTGPNCVTRLTFGTRRRAPRTR